MTPRFLAALALVLAVAALPVAATAQAHHNPQLLRSVSRELPRYAPHVDPATLTPGQVAALHLVLHSNRSQSDIRAQVQSIIGGLDGLLFGRNLTVR